MNALYKRKFDKKINELFTRYGSPLPLEHHEELRKLNYERIHKTHWSAYWAAWNNARD